MSNGERGTRVRFEVGKYYRHVGLAHEIHVLGAVTGSLYHMGPVILVIEEFGDGKPGFYGSGEAAAENWEECAPWCVEDARVFQALRESNPVCVGGGCELCGGSGRQHGPAWRCPGSSA